jgi:signal transduction histidine kinase
VSEGIPAVCDPEWTRRRHQIPRTGDAVTVTARTLSNVTRPALRSLWHAPLAQDGLLTAIAFVMTWAVVWNGGIGVSTVESDRPDAVASTLVVLSTVPLLARRRAPVAVFIVTSTALALLALVYAPVGLPIGPGVALYTVAASRQGVLAPRLLVGIACGSLVYIVACAQAVGGLPWSEGFHGALLLVACWLAGERTRLQRKQLDDLRRDAERMRALAAAEERMRIARDLHDSAGHAINVIAIRAGAARLRHHQEPDRSLEALQTIEEIARQTVGEIDRLVGSLRSQSEATDTLPRRIDSIASLANQHREAGLDVTLRTTGDPRTLPANVEHAAFRIVQEGLTNASRHGRGSAELDLAFEDDALAITIRNPIGKPTGRPGQARHGLLGAGERARLTGGSLASTTKDGVFVLAAQLPYSATEAAR